MVGMAHMDVCTCTAHPVYGLHLNRQDRDGEMVPFAECDDTAQCTRVITLGSWTHRQLKL